MYPDAYEVGLPNQGVQILYEVLNERDWTPRRAHLRRVARHGGGDARARRCPQFTVDAPPPGARLRRVRPVSFSTELGYTNMLTALDLAGIPLHAADRDRRRPDRARRRPRGVQPRADRRLHRRGRRSATARRSCSRSPRWSASGRPRAGPAAATSCCGGSRAPAASTCPRSTTSTTPRTAGSRRVVPNRPGVPCRVRKHTLMDLDAWPYPSQAAGAARRDRARALLGRDLPRLHPRLPLLPGRHDHPPGARALDHRHRRDGRERHPQTGFEEVGLLSLSSADHTEIGEVAKGLADRYEGTNVSLSLPSHPGRRLQHRPGQRVLPQRPPLRPDLRARGRLASGCAR